jgi:zinc protease
MRSRLQDIRKNIYSEIKDMYLSDLKKLFDQNIKNRKYAYCVIGKKSEMDMEALEKLCKVEELTLEQLFGYEHRD